MIRTDRQTISNLKTVGLTGTQIAWVLGVCKRTVQRWVSFQPANIPAVRGRPCKILPLPARWILSQLRDNPYLTQNDIVNRLKTTFNLTLHRSTISRYLQRSSWTKKVPHKANLKCHEDAAELWLQTFKTNHSQGNLMSLDETDFVVGKSGRITGYSPRGERLVKRHDPRSRKMFSLLVCLEEKSTAPVHSMLVEGAITGKLFQNFLDTMPDSLKDNTLLLDNAAIHHATKSLQQQGLPTILETARTKNIDLKYIPAYSPQCNPTELFFASLKKRVQKAMINSPGNIPCTIKSLLRTTTWNVRGMFRHCFDWMT